LLEEITRGSKQSRVEWLVREVGRLRCSEEIRDHIFLSLAVYVLIRPGDTSLSRTFARGLPGRRFFHRRELERRVDLPSTLARSLPASRRLSRNERLRLIDTGRAVLAMLGRETEPISLCDAAGVDYLELERGVAIALYSPPPDRRPLDPQVGLFLFKNGMPVAYGGGWPFLDLCRIGIHIFEPYRGGESAHLFAQVLRVYHQRFGARRFVAETQFGAGDVDGLKSQAFWFYHRFGFRPTDPALHSLADAEAELRAADRSYRSPLPVLRRLARSNLELVLEGGDAPTARCDPADLSHAVSMWIVKRFRGDRAAAERATFEQVRAALGVTDVGGWPASERRAFRSLCLLLGQVPDLSGWPTRDRRRMIAAMRAKGSPSLLRYFDLTRRHARFGRAMAQLVEVSRQAS
jgi:hypothetical protein